MRGLVRERVEVGVRVGIEQQRPGERIENPGAGVGFLALLEADEVVDAHTGQCGKFLAP